MEAPSPVGERSLGTLLGRAVGASVEGRVVLRCREGLRHGLWVQHGYVLGAHVAGSFDPLLELLRRQGTLSERLHGKCVQALHETSARAGAVALQLAQVPREQLRDALQTQLVERAATLLELAEERGHDAWLEPCSVPEREASVRMPLGSLLRRVQRLREQAASRRRKELRELAKALHPDRHPELDPAGQRALSDALARATATYHGLA